MIIELAVIAGYYLLCDRLNPNNRKKEITNKFMEGDIMKEVEKKLRGINITAGGSVNININININNYENSTFTELTFNKSPLNFDFRHSELFTRKQENYLDKALKFSLEEHHPKKIDYSVMFGKTRPIWMKALLGESTEEEDPLKDPFKFLREK